MNLYFRMLWVYLSAAKRGVITLDAMHNKLSMRVWPNDLDFNMHVNNGRYLTICDLSRLDFFIRTGLLAVMLKKRWSPIIREHTMGYYKPLKPLQKFDVEMRITKWDEKYFHCHHLFRVGDRVMAEGTSIAGVRDRKGMVVPATVIHAIDSHQKEKMAKIKRTKKHG
jgi:acyl-CoA thioesterase FadM